MPKQQGDLTGLFQALADPTRRAVIERLGQGPAAASELARPFSMALPSFLQHLDVLEKAGLVTSSKTGRVRTYRLAPRSLHALETWVSDQRELWERRLDQFDEYVQTLNETEH